MSTAQHYQAAEQLLRRPARPGELVVGDKVRPQWIDAGARFWYSVSTGAGRRFVLADPAAGTREPPSTTPGSPPRWPPPPGSRPTPRRCRSWPSN